MTRARYPYRTDQTTIAALNVLRPRLGARSVNEVIETAVQSLILKWQLTDSLAQPKED